MQFLVLVQGNHIHPCFDHLILLCHLVTEFACLPVFRYHHKVVDAILSLVDGVVVGMVFELILTVHHGELRVGRLAQRQIDWLLRVVGYRLCLVLGATVHHIDNLLRLGRDNLIQQLLLRIDELRIDLRTIA